VAEDGEEIVRTEEGLDSPGVHPGIVDADICGAPNEEPLAAVDQVLPHAGEPPVELTPTEVLRRGHDAVAANPHLLT
jgi:hypothetical protein